MRISGRLVLLLAIPLVALLAVTGYGVYHGATRSAEASQLQGRTEVGLLAHALIDDLQTERAGLVADGATDPELRESIQSAATDLSARAADVGVDLGNDVDNVRRRLDAIERVAGADLGGRVALRNYSLAIADLLDLAGEVADPKGAIDDAAASTVDYVARARAASAEEHALLGFLADDGSLDAEAFQQLTALASAQESYAALAAVSSTDPGLTIRIQRVGHAMRAADVLRADAFTEFDSGRDQGWRDGLTERTQELGRLHSDASVLARDAVNDLARTSRTLLVTAALSALAIVLVSAYLLRRAVRTIARPLQDLAVQAEDVARYRLPEAVKAQQQHGGEELHLPALRATGAAEVHEVAAAFNDIQDTALRLAGEQAALRLNQSEAMTNLGRRNQTLLARQLDFISSLETRETDPVFLDHLFKLDHLASRMRRNAESLLILAGSETPRRRRTPAPVTEVVRAAMSEVEEFERVRIGHLRDATVSGPAVIDLVHLLAELIENALGFSPPESTVEIDGRSLGQGGYQFAVIDHGVGMNNLELVAANQRMSGTDELEGMPTRYLGQYVVAKLAQKIGAMVHVQPSSRGRGVTATVNLPGTAMLGSPDRSAVARPMPGSRAAREQGPIPFAPGAGVSELARAGAVEVPVDDDGFGTLFEPVAVSQVATDEAGDGLDVGDAVEAAGREEVAEPELAATEVAHGWGSLPDEFRVPADAPSASQEERPDHEAAEPEGTVPEPAAVAPEDAGLPVPPPAPAGAPEQPDWTPRAGDPDEVAATTAEPAVGPLDARNGGLTRRVPGASLAERNGSVVAADTTPTVERSATVVKSMLSSFQAGRSRGRDDAPQDDRAEGVADDTSADGLRADDEFAPTDDAGTPKGLGPESSEGPMDWRSAT